MDDDIQKYIRCMEEIKLRYDVIEKLLKKEISFGQPMINIEFVCLQFRKITELIMISALCAHKEVYAKIHKSIEKEWEAEKIKRTLESMHQDFYPSPFVRIINTITGQQKNEKVLDGFLTKNECIEVIGRCGSILHAFNPYNDAEVLKNIEIIKNNFPEWQEKIKTLLQIHEIKLSGTEKQLWVYMSHGSRNEVLVEERIPIKK